MSQLPVNEPLEVRIDEPEGSLEKLGSAASEEETADVAARWPECLTAWAALGDFARRGNRMVEAYAYYRVGYHRGLDRLRKSGWRGTGTVPWSHKPNRGFLRSLHGLGIAADAIGEDEEAKRCAEFLQQLAPDAPQGA
jgi:Protein of unknown function (DUF3151)